MTSLPGLHDLIRLQAGRGVLQTPTDDDDDRRQRPKQYWPLAEPVIISTVLW